MFSFSRDHQPMLAPRFHSCSARDWSPTPQSRLLLRHVRLPAGLITRANMKPLFHLRIPQVDPPVCGYRDVSILRDRGRGGKEVYSPVLLRGLTRATGCSSASAPPRARCVSHSSSGHLTPSHVLRADTVLAGPSERKRICALRDDDVQSATETELEKGLRIHALCVTRRIP